MDKLSFMNGYMQKESSLKELLTRSLVHPSLLVGVPTAASYGAGRVVGGLTNPAEGDVDAIQAEYVKLKMDQAIEELERKRRTEKLKRQYVPNTSSLRI